MAKAPKLYASFLELGERLQRNRLDFLRIDLDIALTMAGIAAGAAEGSEKRRRNERNARRAYDAVLRQRGSLVTSPEETKELDDKLVELERALARLGEVF